MKHVLPPGGLQHPPPPPPQILGNSDILGSKRDLGRPNFYKNFHVSFRIFFLERVTFYFILENEQKRYAIIRRVRGLGHTTVSELLMAVQNKVLFDTFPHFSE